MIIKRPLHSVLFCKLFIKFNREFGGERSDILKCLYWFLVYTRVLELVQKSKSDFSKTILKISETYPRSFTDKV